ncbi:hypothetical protein FTO74_09490 [Granulicella sp. WH15]|uniref:putative Ig domain-containing protein n=1 Tax=Granulicella sp. WH15 TaxID=2602070 RepID=UPI0013668D3F|nr:putative Ig domain-containing protein [Granulicella sp. WH15]QHN03577.1 hypothetical protein FTO74_09490 [Granulicella sp. WH15]
MNLHSVFLVKEQSAYRALFRGLVILAFVCLFVPITGCGGNPSPSGNTPPATPSAPTSLAYPQTKIAVTIGQSITTDAPTVTGTVTGYSVSPALPAGLNLSASTGAISGTPTSVAAQAAYTITASNSAGSTTATVQIVVNPAAPATLSYPQTTIVATVGRTIATDTPTVIGTVTGYSVSPALPTGLNLSASTGAISGTPTSVAAQATYTITASNSAGSTTATVQIVVNPAAPATLVYPQTTIVATVGKAIPTDIPTVIGTITGYSVSPALPTGLNLSESTGAISGTPTSIVAQATYTVTASNSTGSTTATVQIVVNAAAPAALVYPQTTITANVGQLISTDTPTVTGTVSSYSVSPALPAGLSLSRSTGAISGVPTAATTQASYTVTAANSAGSTTASVQIIVNSFSVFSLLDLGHANTMYTLRLQPTRLFSQDVSGHWVLWDYTADSQLAEGDPGVQSAAIPYPADMAGSVLAIGIPNAVEVHSVSDGSLITTLTSPSLDPPAGSLAWWKLSTDGSYVVSGFATGMFVWSTTDGHLLFTRSGDYSHANAFAATGQVQIALGPAGSNVIETDSVPDGATSTGPAFMGIFNTWFTDGSHFITNTLNLSSRFNPPVYDVYTYSAASVQQGGTLALGNVQGLHGYANWFWTYYPNLDLDLSLYPVGATTPTATYPMSADSIAVPSGSTLGLITYGAGAVSVLDISGSTPVLTNFTLPVAYDNVFAAVSPTQWAVGNVRGVVLDGPSAATTPRFFGYGNAFSIAGVPGQVAIATASGKILTYNPASPTVVSTINFTSSKIALSTDATVLAAKASDLDSQYEPDRTLSIYSLPAGTIAKSFPYQYNNTTTMPFLFDFTMSSAGNALGQTLGVYNGLYFDYTRQVTPLSGSPIIWSDHPPSGLYTGTATMFLSPDGSLIATTLGGYSSTSTTDIYKNGVLAATINGIVAGWIDNNRVLVNTFTAGVPRRRFTLGPSSMTPPARRSLRSNRSHNSPRQRSINLSPVAFKL